MRQTELQLTNKDRRTVAHIRSQGLHLAREVNRAHILAALDEKISESQIMQVLGVGRTAIWRTRNAYLEGGLAGWSTPCAMWRALAGHGDTRPTPKRR